MGICHPVRFEYQDPAGQPGVVVHVLPRDKYQEGMSELAAKLVALDSIYILDSAHGEISTEVTRVADWLAVIRTREAAAL